MPPEPLPWDRKDFFKGRKHDRSSESLGSVARWRETPHRWGSADFRTRHPGHGKQSWNLFSEEYGNGFMPTHSDPSGFRGDGKYSRNIRESRGSFSQNGWRGQLRETGASPNDRGRPYDVSDQRSVDDSHPHSDFVNSWDQLHCKDQHDKISSVNGLGTGQKFEREKSLGSSDWKSLKWSRSGNLSSRGSGFSHSSSSKSIGVDANEAKAKIHHGNATMVQLSSRDAGACVTSTAPSEETHSGKKPRLGWGEGLAKFEKKKVEGSDDDATKNGMVYCASTEPIHSHVLNLADKSPRIVGLSDSASPATPSSFSCSSSPGVEDKPFVKTASFDNDTSNLGGSPNIVVQNPPDGLTFNPENVELTSIADLNSSLGGLLQFDDLSLVGPGFLRSTATNKLLVLKGDISKALEITESEIDLLENELKSLLSESGNNYPCPASSSSTAMECQAKPCEELGAISNLISKPAPLQVVYSGDMIVEKAVHDLEEHTEVKDQDIDSPGTVTSKFIKRLSAMKATSPSDAKELGECRDNLDVSSSRNLDVKCLVYDFNKEKTGVSTSGDGTHLIANLAPLPTDVNSHCKGEDKLYDLILATNKDSANRASEVFKKLLPSGQCHIDILGANGISRGQNDPLIKERFAMRKRFLRFKDRVITLKFRAFQHLWKEDVRLLSVRKYRAKSQKRFEQSSRTAHGGYQKHRSSTRSRFSSAGNLCLVPTTETIDLMSKLLSDSKVKLYRNTLKMPALILDKEEKTSRFISSNGLVEDPCGFEKERAMVNPWTSEEKEIFMDKLATLGKDFRKISSFLSHKTTADCIEFYYKNHKSDCFEKTTKKPESAKQGKSYSTNNYMVTSGRRWNHEMNAASLSMLGAASAIAANADDGTEVQQKCTSRFLATSRDCKTPPGDDGNLERSSSHDMFGNERETVAADVLAGICGSISSEAMSSCITSSFDLGEGYQEWKCQKTGSLKRRPLTPEVAQNLDDESSDESFEETDPADWTDEEKSIFIQAVSLYGKDFAKISLCVQTRSRNQCKVFFSKARKCLGLDMIRLGHCNDGTEDDINGGGSDTEDACVAETGSVVCSDKSGSKMDEDPPFSDLKINHGESDPVGTMNSQIDMKKSEENNTTGRQDCKDPESGSENLVTDGKLVLDVDGDCTIGNDANSKSVTDKAHNNAAVFSNTETGQDGATGDLLEDAVSFEEGNDRFLSVSGAENETKPLGQVSAELVRTGLEEQQPSPGNNLKDKPDERNDSNRSGQSGLNCAIPDPITIGKNTSNVVADTKSSSGFGANHKILHEVALESDPAQEPHVISLQQDGCLVTASLVPRDSVAIQYEKIGDEQCQKSFSANDHYKYLPGEQARDHMRLHSRSLSDIEKPASFQSFSKLDRNFYSQRYLSQDYYFRKCNSSKTQSANSDVSSVSQEQARDYLRSHSQSLSDVEKPSGNGDVKLFGKILSNPSSQQKLNSSAHENEDPKLSDKSSNLKLIGTHSIDGNLVPADNDNILGIENLPRRSYGFWDRNRIKTGFHSLPDSAILLAKYPAAFGYTSSFKMEQRPLHSVVKVNGHNINGLSVFPTREIGDSNGVADFQVYRNWDDTKGQPFTVDMKQRQDLLFSEMERRNGFEAVPSIQEQGKGMVGIDVGRGGGILACNGVSDPVAAIRMHYAKAERYGGQAGTIIGEESWRGKGEVGR